LAKAKNLLGCSGSNMPFNSRSYGEKFTGK
jgi:hypothetical protein